MYFLAPRQEIIGIDLCDPHLSTSKYINHRLSSINHKNTIAYNSYLHDAF